MTKFALKGDIAFTSTPGTFEVFENSYILCRDGRCAGIVKDLADTEFKNSTIHDYSGKLIVPGFTDLHIHAPQFLFRGMGMDLPLLEWLNTYTFPIEEKFADTDYARKSYTAFADQLACSPTTRALVFGTIHRVSDGILASLLEKTGLKVFLGKVNMDRNSPDSLTEDTGTSLAETEQFIRDLTGLKNVLPAVTPRFVPSCSSGLMEGLGRLAEKYGIPVQSHLDENTSEIAWVRELHPDCPDYASVYKKYRLLNQRTVMAHCVHLSEAEQNLLRESGTFIAHCPQSNTNLVSGAAPVLRYMERGIPVGLGTDVAAGSSVNMFRAAADAVQVSKLRCSLAGDERPLKVSEAFYMATKGGGAFFGNCGSFEQGYTMDAVVVDDSGFSPLEGLSPSQRAERLLYLADSRNVLAKFVEGECVYEKS